MQYADTYINLFFFFFVNLTVYFEINITFVGDLFFLFFWYIFFWGGGEGGIDSDYCRMEFFSVEFFLC